MLETHWGFRTTYFKVLHLLSSNQFSLIEDFPANMVAMYSFASDKVSSYFLKLGILFIERSLVFIFNTFSILANFQAYGKMLAFRPF